MAEKKEKWELTEAQLAAIEFVDSVVSDATKVHPNIKGNVWHGWVLRAAFEAGAKWGQEKQARDDELESEMEADLRADLN